MVKRIQYIALIFLLLLLGGLNNDAWAGYKVTYHILTLPMDHTKGTANTNASYDDWRTEAIKVVVANASTIQLEAHFKSPLAKNFTYYPESVISKDATARQIYQYRYNNKYYLFKAPLAPYVKVTVSGHSITNEEVSNATAWGGADSDHKKTATSYADMEETQVTSLADGTYYFSFQDVCLTEGDPIPSNDYHVYVTYEYDANNTIAKLDGTEAYNIFIDNKFLAYNRGRNNRVAGIPSANVSGEQLASDNFVYVNVSDVNTLKDKTYWSSTDNKNPIEVTKSKFHFLFKYIGEDPYNVTIVSAYNSEEAKYYIEKYGSETQFVKKWYEGSSLFAKTTDEMIIGSDENRKYTQTDWDNPSSEVTFDASDAYRGYYHGILQKEVIWNSFALLFADNGSGGVVSGKLVFMGSRTVKSDGSLDVPSGQFYYLGFDNPATVKLKKFAKASAPAADEQMYEVYTYTFKVKTSFGNVISVEKKWSEAYGSQSLMEHIPDALKRKYVNFTKAYTSDNTSTRTEITTFADADANNRVIWLDYTTSMPFETVPKNALGNYSYTDARWYTLRMNGNVEDQYLAYQKSSNFVTANEIRGSNSNLHKGENSAEAQFAFIGDPFELKILSRAASENATPSSVNMYVGCATSSPDGTSLTSVTGSSDISTWEIEYDNVSGSTMKIRKYGALDDVTPMYIGWNSVNENKPLIYSITGSYVKVVELEKKNYVYHIVRSDGSIAIKATEAQDVGKPLSYKNIPDIIRSPGIANATLSYYWTDEDAMNTPSPTNPKTHAPYSPDTEGFDIYVRYDFGGVDPLGGAIHDVKYFVVLNGENIYFDSDAIKSVPPQSLPESENDAYQWELGGNDPYAMTIQNVGASFKYVNVDNWAAGTISWSTEVPSSKFIVKLSPYSTAQKNVYEVMAATGDGVDASSTYYNIARIDANTIQMASNSTSAHGSPTLRFELTRTDANTHNVRYHLIDKSGIDLLDVVTRQAESDKPEFPTEYHSPLVADYHYYVQSDFTPNVVNEKTIYSLKGTSSELSTIGTVTDVYVTYTTGTSVDLTNKKTMYLLKFAVGEEFRQENGTDDLLDPIEDFIGSEADRKALYQAVYPYCNGDGNFFVYGQDQFDTQQQGAASTRTRWAWFLESAENDPYHVKICSRQTETYNNDELRAYFSTYQPHDYDKIVTGLVWPSISGIQGTEYMILGTSGHYRLVTSNGIPLDSNLDGVTDNNERQSVTSFEQYWKTYDTIKNKLLKKAGILKPEDEGANPNGSILVPTDPASYRALLTGTGSDQYGFHSYSKWSYAKRFNGYNREGKTSKGWEELEHWFQTVNMGEGVFDLVSIDINPVLILLDQHGWEIMRKPLPTDPNDPTKAAKYDAIRPYDSPMVKEYYFWTKASKRSGFHQYYNLSQLVMNNGKPYTSTSLTELPPYDSATNLHDAKGNHLDEYVTYIVKDEYAQCYNPETKAGEPFLIQQGDNYASYNGRELASPAVVPNPGGMSQYIIDNSSKLTLSGDKKNDLWYIKPNTDIDKEMGYTNELVSWDNPYKLYLPTARTASLITDEDNVKSYGGFSFSNGFDPYNIQISSAVHSKYFVSNSTGATIEEGQGSIVGSYSADPEVAIGNMMSVSGTWYDSRVLDITNATFMAIQDANGNMQLMPRFDQTRRMKNFRTLTTPDDPEVTQTHTQLFRPLVYNYHIIDNAGNESLRYNSGGDLVPQMPDHFKSPLAKEYQYYTTQTFTSENEITESFARKGLTESTNDVYVRYAYDEEADVEHILKGKWVTMQLNTRDVQYTTVGDPGTPGIYADADTPTKPSPINGTAKTWQWKFLETPLTEPDPYAVKLFNRNNKGNALPASDKRFAILSHSSGGYALAEAGTESNSRYLFLQGIDSEGAPISSSKAATIAQEEGFLSTSCAFSGTNSQVQVNGEDVEYTFTYKIFTNGNVFAVSAVQDNATLIDNDYAPVLPEAIKSPLLNMDQYCYYEQNLAESIDTVGKALKNLYGLYDDNVYVRYDDYNPRATSYIVPNERNPTGTGQVERANTSNDASIDINNELLYNIIWFDDKMMTGSNDNSISDGGSRELGGSPSGQVWYLAGNDPYAIKLRTIVGDTPADRYVHKVVDAETCDLTATEADAITFMLLPREDNYKYGMLQVTDGTGKLTGNGSTLTTGDAVPDKFIIFALSTHKVTYHLVISNIGSAGATIPYFEVNDANPEGHLIDKTFSGTTQRNLTNNPIADHEVGHISLGDPLKVPTDMIRPNVDYFFYVDEIIDVNNDGTDGSQNETLTNLYKGHLVKAMAVDSRLVGKHVKINIVYTFQGGLATNAGDGFVTDVSQNKWYTFKSLKDDGTPRLMQFTNAWGMEVKDGEGTHYTNDYLWSPIGDPYGFKMHHRYTRVNSGAMNSGEPNRIMTTADFSEGTDVKMDDGSQQGVNTIPLATAVANSVYELLDAAPNAKSTGGDATTSPGYFYIHPVANSGNPQVYFKIVHALEPGSSTVYHDYVKLSSTDPSEFTFGLSEDMVKPYYDRAGYVGGLTTTPKPGQDKSGKKRYEEATTLIAKQAVVYNPVNIVDFTPGYYRLHSPEDISGIATRYASGYTHKKELVGGENAPLPMHFYERKGINTTFEILGSGFTFSESTRGALPISAPEYDPASIFHVYYVPSTATPYDAEHPNRVLMSTQGLYLKGERGFNEDEAKDPVVRSSARMTDDENLATPLFIMDIGGAILLIHDDCVANGRARLKYLSFDQNDPDHIYDLKLTNNTHTDHAKWLMEPVNAQGLKLNVNSGGDAGVYGATYYYTTFYAPFDILLPDNDPASNKTYIANICQEEFSPWPVGNGELHPKSIGVYNTGTYAGKDQFVPAGTPVLIATTDNAGSIKATIPTNSPSTPLASIFTGQFLEQKLDAGNDVFVFGLPFTSELRMDPESGDITGTLPQKAATGAGFYLNANQNKELGLSKASWTRNNWYVLGNKIYYRASASPARKNTRGIEFVPVVFDDEEGEVEQDGIKEQTVGDNRVYDLLGRCVATEEQVKDGTWRQNLRPGIYILNGRKIRK